MLEINILNNFFLYNHCSVLVFKIFEYLYILHKISFMYTSATAKICYLSSINIVIDIVYKYNNRDITYNQIKIKIYS